MQDTFPHEQENCEGDKKLRFVKQQAYGDEINEKYVCPVCGEEAWRLFKPKGWL